MNSYIKKEIAWAEGYYSAMKGCKVVDISVEYDGEYVWPVLVCEKTINGKTEQFVIEIARDPEGNGPGFLFGLPSFMPEEGA